MSFEQQSSAENEEILLPWEIEAKERAQELRDMSPTELGNTLAVARERKRQELMKVPQILDRIEAARNVVSQ